METLHLRLGYNQYISDYYNKIDEFVFDNRKALLVAPPRSGKSKFFAEYAKRNNAIIIVPFNSLLTTYEHYGIEAIHSGSNTPDTLETNKPYVMVWNQAVAQVSHDYMKQIKDRVLLFDETHLLMLHKTFRDDIVPLLDTLITNAREAILTTATECCEAEIWDLPRIEFTRSTTPKERVEIMCYANFLPKQSMELMIDAASGCLYKDTHILSSRDMRIAVFTNRYAQELFDRYKLCAYCRADNGKHKSNQSGIDTIEQETLLERLTIITDYGKFGINLFNPDNDVVVIVDMEYGESTYIDLLQAIGRIREYRSLQVFVIQSAPRGKRKCSAQKFINNQAVKRSVTAPTILTDKQKEMFKMLDKFIERHTDFNAVKRDVEAFNGGQYKITVKGGKMLKVKADELRYKSERCFRADYMIGSIPEVMPACCIGWLNDIRELEAQDVPFRKFWALYCDSPKAKPDQYTPIKYTPLPKIIEYVKDVKMVMEMTENDWNIFVQQEEDNIRNVIMKGADEGTVRKVRLELAHKVRIREEWIVSKCYCAEDRWQCMLDAEAQFRMEALEYAGRRRKEGNSNGGKVGGSKSRRNVNVTILVKQTGRILTFGSVAECCEFLHCTKPTFKRFKNGLSELNVKYDFVEEVDKTVKKSRQVF